MEEHFAYKHIIENKSFLHKELLFKLNEDLEVKEEDVLEEKNEIIQEEVKEEVKEVIESVVLEVKEVLEEKNEIIEEYIWCLHIDCLCKLDYFSNITELEKHMLEDH